MEKKRDPEHGVLSVKQNAHVLGGGRGLISKDSVDGNSSCLNLGPWKVPWKGNRGCCLFVVGFVLLGCSN